MKLKDAREFYYFFTGKTSEIVRQLALAGIAVIWLFKTGQNQVPAELLLPLSLIALTLVLDLLQYFVAATIWGIYSRSKEKLCEKEKAEKSKGPHNALRGATRGLRPKTAEAPAEFDFQAPRELNWPGVMFFYLKAISLVAAYWFIFQYLYPKIHS